MVEIMEWLAVLFIGCAAACDLLRTCGRCNGSGFVRTKNGGVKICPFCEQGQVRN
jgi:hypothetical protein